ncbi:WD repeat-containing and planar cell polarity effector protein fritz-like protein, partial [Stegodyphus mimosarum]
MASFLTSLYLLNFKQVEAVHNREVDCIKVCERDLCSQGPYRNAKREYFLNKCSKCKQQYRKKDVKYVNKLFMSYKCLYLSWDINQPLIMFFSNGTIVSVQLNIGNNTVEKIEIDDNLNGKLFPSKVVDVVICQSCIFITYSEPKLAVIYMNRSSPSFSTKIFGKKRGKLVGPEPKIMTVDLIGPCSKSLERKLSLNLHNDHLLVWWRFSDDDVWPWTPVVYSMERVNMLIYSLNDGIEILCTAKVNGELINAIYSKQNFNQILTLEEVKCKAERSINVCIYEVVQNQCHHIFVAKLPMHGSLISFDWSSTVDKLIVSDSNRLLLIYDLREKSTIVTYLSFLPKEISWHPENCLAIIIGTANEIQCFDAALNCISFEMYYSKRMHNIIDLNSFFPHHFTPQKVLWQ